MCANCTLIDKIYDSGDSQLGLIKDSQLFYVLGIIKK